MKKQVIEDYLTQFIGEKIIYVPNPGNAGDALIACATYQLLNKLNIEYKTGEVSKTYPGSIVLYGGGGNLVKPYLNAINFIKNNHKIVEKLTVLPHTIRDYGEVLSTLGSNVDIICREIPSYEYCAKYISNTNNLYLANDMAFSVSVEQVFREKALLLYDRSTAIKNLKRKVREIIYRIKNIPTVGTLNSYRLDVEKTKVRIPFNNIDVSQSHALDEMNEQLILDCVASMFSFITKYDVINTNRLHVAISGLILGKKVNFYDNSYGKNHSVYLNSIKDNYKNINWMV